VVLVAGNHDSPDRIAFGGRVAQRQGLVLRGTLEHLDPVIFEDAHGPVAVHPVPYLEPAFVRDAVSLEEARAVQDHPSATQAILARLQADRSRYRRNVLVGHAFVSGGTESESERPLTVGGSGAVPHTCFDGFDYVALGHLHRPQSVGRSAVQYSGSLLKYSFNEVDHAKSVSVVDLDATGAVQIERVALAARRDVRIVTGPLAALLQSPQPGVSREDYLRVVLTDPDPVLDPIGRLREVYPNLMELQFARLAGAGAQAGGPEEASPAGGPPGAGRRDHRQRTPEDLFRAFYREMLGEDLDEAALEVFSQAARNAESAQSAQSPSSGESGASAGQERDR